MRPCSYECESTCHTIFRLGAVLFIGALAGPFGRAQEVNWIGGVGNYSDGTNWSGGTVPDAYESIVIDNGGTAQASGTISIEDVSLGGGSILQVMPGIPSNFDANLFYVGTSGTGTLVIGSQAVVNTGDFYAGYGVGAIGNVNMDGAYLSPYATYIGYAGNATFVLENGSTLQSTTASVGPLAGSHGIIQLTDSTWKAEEESQPLGITVGEQGIGEVQASGESLISALSLTVGDGGTSSGTVSLSGGTLTITDGIQVGNAGSGELALSDSATSTSYSFDIGVLAGSTGKVSVTDSTLKSDEVLHVGLSGNGSLETSGAEIQAPKLVLGRNAGSTGTATISGGTTTITGDLVVGEQGNGTLTLQDGGTLTTAQGSLGVTFETTGTVNVLGGNWSSSQDIYVGVAGSCTLTTGAGGLITSENGYVAQDAGSTGTVTMNGGQWVMSNTLVVGITGVGQFSASNEASVSSEWAQIALNPGSSGYVTLDNALWTTTNTLTIGSAGDGEFHALNGSVVTAGAIELSASESVKGLLEVTNAWLVTDVLTAYGDGTVSFSGATIKLLGGATVTDTLLISGFASGNAVIDIGGLTIDTQGGSAQIASELSGTGALTKTGEGGFV